MAILTATIVIRCCSCDKVVGTVSARSGIPGTVSTNKPCYECENTARMQREASARYQNKGRN
jgi:hypothetical protein